MIQYHKLHFCSAVMGKSSVGDGFATNRGWMMCNDIGD